MSDASAPAAAPRTEPAPQSAGSSEALPLLPHERPLAPAVDLAVAAAFFAFSAGIIGVGLSMPNYADQGGAIYQAPGFVPIFYGVVMGALSLWLAARSIGRRPHWSPEADEGREGNSPGRLILAAGLGILFVVGLLGRMPFWLATAIFVGLFVMAFEWQLGAPLKARLRTLAIAIVLGLATGAAITLVFSRVFLVRLP